METNGGNGVGAGSEATGGGDHTSTLLENVPERVVGDKVNKTVSLERSQLSCGPNDGFNERIRERSLIDVLTILLLDPQFHGDGRRELDNADP